ncbi:hypothetical protein GBAR_LOCUS3629 [Geodia barretti]|uniref:Uncharacterized protein n=1 Tax=Geodia barretti TaxID=519541 RepID=A0AA35R3X9_GEOBA|nr:hypothetical protein GBAR_LOCUS3629 [Geodia barretti]
MDSKKREIEFEANEPHQLHRLTTCGSQRRRHGIATATVRLIDPEGNVTIQRRRYHVARPVNAICNAVSTAPSESSAQLVDFQRAAAQREGVDSLGHVATIRIEKDGQDPITAAAPTPT